MINKPILPPKAGYVERVNAEGVHYYEPTAETLAKLQREEAEAQIQADMDGLLVDYEFRLTMLELGLFE